MKGFLFGLLSLLSFGVNAQDYRLAYDSSTIPELYHQTTLILQQKNGDRWNDVTTKYKLISSNLQIIGKSIAYSEDVGKIDNGRIKIIAVVENREVPLTLQLPVLQDIRYHLYTDSIKPILNYYVNVEGVYSSGRIYPLTEQDVTITADIGRMVGMAWEAPNRTFDKVTFTVSSRLNPTLSKTIILYRQRRIDPRDALDYED